MRSSAFLILAAIFLAAVSAVTNLTESSAAVFVPASNVFVCSPIPILIGGPVNGGLATGDCVDANSALYDGYTFNGTPGEPIDITLASEAFVPSVRLVQGSYPGGTVIATGTDPGNGTRRINAFSVPSTGTYTIVASSASAGASGGYTLILETTNPRVEQIQRTSTNPAIAGTSVTFGIFFTSSVTGVDANDFVLTTTGVTGASITNVNGTGTVYSVTVNSGTGAGTIRLDLIDNDTIVNSSGVPLGGPGLGNGNFVSGPSYTITAGTPTPTPTPTLNAVVTNADDSGAGSLRESISVVLSGGTITFSSFFNSPRTILLTSGELRILKNVTINGPGADLLTISAGNSSRVFNIGQSSPGNTVAISGLRIINGRAPDGDFGGGLEQNFGTLTLSNCEFAGNSAPVQSAGIGGAIDFFEGTLNISDCNISGNSSVINGGGIAAANAVVTITNSSIAGNVSGGGGGLHIFGGSAAITGSTFSGNTVTNRGGAIFAQNCGITLVNSTISGNTGDTAAGAIAGAIAFESTSGVRTAQITSATIANNTATSGEAGAIFVGARFSGSSATVNLRNSIFAGNAEPAMQASATSGQTAAISSQGFNLATSGGNGFLTQLTDRLNAQAGIAPLANNGGRTLTHRLLATSAAIDAGNSFGLTNDQRGVGFQRIVDLAPINASGGDGSDIGSFELQSEPPPTIATVSGRVATPSGLGLRNAIVTITDPQGVRRTATTSSFGVYSFSNVPTGFNYILSVSSKRYRFTPQMVPVSGNLSNVDFFGLE